MRYLDDNNNENSSRLIIVVNVTSLRDINCEIRLSLRSNISIRDKLAAQQFYTTIA